MRFLRWLGLVFGVSLVVWACGGDSASTGGDGGDAGRGSESGGGGDAGGDASPAPSKTFTVGGTVTGLLGAGLTLQNNGGDNLAVSGNGAFTFSTRLASGAAYAVTVRTQPNTPTQTCTIGAGSGIVAAADVTAVTLTCTTSKFTIGGTVTGLEGTGLVLQNNGGDDLTINADGVFTFATPVQSGSDFNVTVKAAPPLAKCTASGAAGKVTAGNVASVTVNCSKLFTVGGTISGLAGTVVLQNKGADDLIVNANGDFAFATAWATGTTYDVTVLTQPAAPAQICTVDASTGAVASANVTSVVVTCKTRYTIGGTITGLGAGTVIMQNNGGDDLQRNVDGPFTFATSIVSGQNYAVTVLTQPAAPLTCRVSSGTGPVGAADIVSVKVTCAPLIAYYAFDEGAGAAIVDSSHNGNDGTHNAAYVAGKKGTALAFNGATGAKVIGNAAFTWGAANADYTVEYWIYLLGTNGNWVSPFHKSDVTGDNCCAGTLRTPAQFFFPGSLSIAPVMGTVADGNHYWVAGTPAFALNQWVHFADVHKGTQQLIYMDGVLVVTDDLGSDTVGGQGVLYLGYDTFYAGLNGYMDEVRILGRALAVEEIQAEMQ